MLDALRFEAGESPRLVHRLDRDTSGVLLLGRSAEAANRLAQAFRAKTARKLYWALTAGGPQPAAGRIDLPLAKLKRGGGEKMGHDPVAGKPAATLYTTVEHVRRPMDIAWVALSPLTGRTHQLRAHLAAIGTPILGDGKYGGRAAFPENMAVQRLQLHAREVALPHPADGTTLRVTAPLPGHMRTPFETLGFDTAAGAGVEPEGN
jgi:23S rRNA pseudouridine955/2504/2580 synthase